MSTAVGPSWPAVVVSRRPLAAESIRGTRRRSLLETGLRWSVPVVLVAVWQVAAELGWINTRYFPSPAQIWTAGVDLVDKGRLQEAVVDSGWRVLWGFLWGSLVGFAVGVVLGTSRLARRALEPVVYALWSVPKLAVLPLLLLIFGFGNLPIIWLVILNTMFLVMIPTAAAMASVPEQFPETARTFSVGRWQMFWHVRLPAALPEVFVALKLSAGASILVVVAAEFVTGGSGVGYLIWNSWQVLLPDPMYVGIVTAAVLGSVFTLLVSAIGRWVAPWADGM